MNRRFRRFLKVGIFTAALCVGLFQTRTARADEEGVDIESTFPDEVFRAYVSDNFDSNRDGVLVDVEIQAVEGVYVENLGISSLQGIEVFVNLTNLNCVNNQLNSLDVSQNRLLEELYCSENQLESLDVSQNTALKHLSCSDNRLTNLTLGQNDNLGSLHCTFNDGLTEVDVSGVTKLNELTALWDQQNPEGYLTGNGDWMWTVADGWSDFDEMELWVESTTRVIANPALTYYTVTFDSNGGSAVSSVTSKNNHVLKEREAPTKDGMEFVGWFADEECTNRFNFVKSYDIGDLFEATPVTNDITLYAKWSEPIAITDTFPNDTFRTYVSQTFDSDSDGYLSLQEIENATLISVDYCEISSLQGIEVFTELAELRCTYCGLTELDLSNNTKLLYLSCSGNQLTSLDLSHNTSLGFIDCQSNQLSSLQLGDNTVLRQLLCGGNSSLGEMDLSVCSSLTELSCQSAGVTKLTLGNNEWFKTLYCPNNQLTTLDLSGLPSLNYLTCSCNPLPSIDVSNAPAINATVHNCSPEQGSMYYDDGQMGFTELWTDDTGYLYIDSSTMVIANPAVSYVTVSFNSNGGSEVDSVKTFPNHIIMEPQSPVWGNSVFMGWYSDEALTNSFSFGVDGTVVTGNTTLYAKWGDPIVIADTFPDEIFREYIAEQLDNDSDGYLSREEINNATSINVDYYGISSLQGIEVLSELTYLNCGFNLLTELNVSNNPRLLDLYCSGNQLEELNVNGNAKLRYLSCVDNQLSFLDLSQNTALDYLDCSGNKLAQLNLSGNGELSILYCSENALTTLDVSTTESLTVLECAKNLLTELELGQNESLYWLDCSDNYLSQVDVRSKSPLNALVHEKQAEMTTTEWNGKTDNLRLYWWNEDVYHRLMVDVSAQVVANPALQYYTVSFDSNGGTDVADVKGLSGYAIEEPATPTREGMEFGGWYTEPACTNRFIFGTDGTPVTSNITLYAEWQVPIVIVDTFPDEIFRAYISEQFDSDSDGCLSRQEIENVQSINVESYGISSLQGIEVLSELIYLNCGYNSLTELNVRNNSRLQQLYCYENQLSELYVSENTELLYFACSGNKLTSLDLTCNTMLMTLDCSRNKLTQLTLGDKEQLASFDCSENALTNLDVSTMDNLYTLDCRDNQLTELKLGQNPNLNWLDCSENCLTKVDIRNVPLLNILVNNLLAGITFTSDNYKLNWWNEDTGYWMMVDAPAQVVADPALQYCTVSFDSNGGSDVEDLKGLSGYPVGEPTTPTKEDKEFGGWYTEPTFTNRFFFGWDGTPVTSDITLYARWGEPVYLATAFEDENFRNYVASNFDENQDGRLSFAERDRVLQIYVSDMEIASLKGIEYFPNLTDLYCSGNQLTRLDVSHNTKLAYLMCYYNNLAELNVSGNTELKWLNCSDNQLTSLNVSSNTKMESFQCSWNLLTELDVDNNTELTILECDENQLTELDVTSNTKLTNLLCRGNLLESLNLENCSSLIWFFCEGNQMSSLDITSCQELCSFVARTDVDKQYSFYHQKSAMCDSWCDFDAQRAVSIDSTTRLITTPALEYVTVNFNTNGGSDIPSITALKGYPIGEPEMPTKDGTYFLGWYSDEACTTQFTFGLAGNNVNESITLYALWYEESIDILGQPVSTVILPGGSAMEIWINASGPEPLSYQWQKKGLNSSEWENIESGDAPQSITLVGTADNHGYEYRCVVSDNNGHQAISDITTLTVIPYVHIGTGVLVSTAGAVENITVEAIGVGPLTYQWQYQAPGATKWTNSSVASAKTATYSFTVKYSHDGYLFRCVVTDGNGNQEISDEIAMIVPAVVTTQPESKTVKVGDSTSLTVAATGKGTLKYRWQYKAPGATYWNYSSAASAKTATYTFEAKASHNGYQFRCVITDGNDNMTISDAATLTVAPKVTTQPQSKTVKVGESASLSVAVTGKATLKYQWQYMAPGATKWSNSSAASAKTATYTFDAKAAHNGYQFRCVITDGNGNRTNSDVATLTVVPKVTTQPQSKTVKVGDSTSLSVAATGKATLKYQWQYMAPGATKWSNSSAASAKTATYTFTAKAGHNGYQFRCVITDGNGNQTISDAATLTVAPKITTQPQSKTVKVGDSTSLTVAATGKATLKYQWQYKAPGATSWSNSSAASAKTATYTFAAKAGHNGYQFRCVITDGNGNQTISNAATLTVKK